MVLNIARMRLVFCFSGGGFTARDCTKAQLGEAARPPDPACYSNRPKTLMISVRSRLSLDSLAGHDRWRFPEQQLDQLVAVDRGSRCGPDGWQPPREVYIAMIGAAGSRRRRSDGSLVMIGSCRSLARITTDASIISDVLVAPQSSPQERASCASSGIISTSSLLKNRPNVT